MVGRLDKPGLYGLNNFLFHPKSKVNINLMLMRIEIIKRRRNALHKFSRSDIAELLKIGHGSDAFRRAGRLYLDQNRTLCYDFAARYCTLISEQVAIMNNQSKCPEECKEAVASLIYAAARFGDLPELRKLRSLFTERYGDSLEPFVNKEFVDLLNPNLHTKDMKVKLMQEIAQEHGVEWDPESLDGRLYKPYSSRLDSSINEGEDEEKEPCITDRENGWKIKIQETMNDDSNARQRYESNDDIVNKKIENMRRRIQDYWSRASSLLSASPEPSTSHDESSTSSDDSTKSRPFSDSRFMPPPYVINDHNNKDTSVTVFDPPTNNVTKENKDVSNQPIFEKLENEKTLATPPTTKNRWWRKGGSLPRAKLHPSECLVNPTAVEESIENTRTGSHQSDLTVNSPMGHVHSKLPDYDEIRARFAAHKARSSFHVGL